MSLVYLLLPCAQTILSQSFHYFTWAQASHILASTLTPRPRLLPLDHHGKGDEGDEGDEGHEGDEGDEGDEEEVGPHRSLCPVWLAERFPAGEASGQG